LKLFGKKKNATQVGSTQEIIKFAEIRESIIILKDGNLRQVLLCSSINFDLKSEQEQDAIIFRYQSFLNSLEFPIQILMQSKKLDLSNYLAKLDKVSKEQTNELLRYQTEDYVNFVRKLVDIANIMDKRFYVVVPYLVPIKVDASKIRPRNPEGVATLTYDEFKKYQTELEQRVQVVQSGLGSIGVRTAVLNTQQLIELFYNVYNPEEAAKEKLINADDLQGEVIQSELSRPSQEQEQAKEETANE